jgi:hypothetical protein
LTRLKPSHRFGAGSARQAGPEPGNLKASNDVCTSGYGSGNDTLETTEDQSATYLRIIEWEGAGGVGLDPNFPPLWNPVSLDARDVIRRAGTAVKSRFAVQRGDLPGFRFA